MPALTQLLARLPENRLRWVPAAAAVTGALMAGLLLVVDALLPADFGTGWVSPSAARALVAGVATATVTAASLVFWIRGMLVSMASSRFSPRVLTGYLRDRWQQGALSFTIGVFSYSAVVVLAIPGADGAVPVVSVLMAAVLAVGILIAIALVIDESVSALDSDAVIRSVTDRALAAVRRTMPEQDGDGAARPRPQEVDGGPRMVRAGRLGWVQQVDVDRLLAALPEPGQASVRVRVGSFVDPGTHIVTVKAGDEVDLEAIAQAIVVGQSRSVQNDVLLAVRTLADFAVIGLGGGQRDTAAGLAAIAHLVTVLREILLRGGPREIFVDGDRQVRLEWELTPDDYVSAALDPLKAVSPEPATTLSILDGLDDLREQIAAAGLDGRGEAVAEHARQLLQGLDGPLAQNEADRADALVRHWDPQSVGDR